MCPYQEVDVTLITHSTDSGNGDLVSVIGPNRYLGHSRSTSSVTYKITKGLEREQNYLLKIVLNTTAGNSTNYYLFSKL